MKDINVLLQDFFNKYKNDKNLSGKIMIIPKTEIKNHYSGWSVPNALKRIIDEK